MPADWTVLVGDNRQTLATIAPQSVDLCVTSPPYYGLRKYGDDSAEIGREQTPEQYLAALVEVFRLVRAALKPTGSVWVNLGDSYAGSSKSGPPHSRTCHSTPNATADDGMNKPGATGQLLGIPWRFALAMQADGWTLRSDIIWAKGMSFLPNYSGSCMPQSVRGVRWERCRVHLKKSGNSASKTPESNGRNPDASRNPELQSQWSDCPGCPKCEPNGGLVLRRGQWRPTTGHEYVFMFTLGDAVLDCEAVRERGAVERGIVVAKRSKDQAEARAAGRELSGNNKPGVGYECTGYRNLRTVWAINPEPSPERHYAMYPRKLVRPIVTVATSARGCCPACGAPWARVIATERASVNPRAAEARVIATGGAIDGGTECSTLGKTDGVESKTLGFRPTCDCGREDVAPSVVLDPFHGGGTTGIVCDELSEGYGCKDGPRPLKYIGCELHEEYLSIGEARRKRFAERRADARHKKTTRPKPVEVGPKQMELF